MSQPSTQARELEPLRELIHDCSERAETEIASAKIGDPRNMSQIIADEFLKNLLPALESALGERRAQKEVMPMPYDPSNDPYTPKQQPGGATEPVKVDNESKPDVESGV